MTRTSHKKNRPFDFKLISLVQPHPVLYHRHWGGFSSFECMKEKTRLWNEIGEKMGVSPDFCLSRWNNLKNHFQRELRHCTELCPREGIIRGSTWPYLKSMCFLKVTMRSNKPIKPTHSNKRDQKGIPLFNLEAAEERISEAKRSESFQRNECIEEFEELENEMFDNEKSAILPSPDKLIQERLTNFEQMAELFENTPSHSKIQIEGRIMAYLCKCQLRAIANEGIDDLTI